MVINNNDINPPTLGILDLLEIRNAVIYGNDQRDVFRKKRIERLSRQAVPLFIPVRIVDFKIFKPDGAKKLAKNHGSANAIGIIIAKNNNFFLSLDRRKNPIRGALHSLHLKRIMRIALVIGMQESLGFFLCF